MEWLTLLGKYSIRLDNPIVVYYNNKSTVLLSSYKEDKLKVIAEFFEVPLEEIMELRAMLSVLFDWRNEYEQNAANSQIVV
ncbi:MAG: hypothetical protein ACUVQP_00165 [Bacteroidales bacterium]